LGPLGIAATNRPIVPAPGDIDDGEIGGIMTGWGNRSTRRKPVPVPLCPLQTPHAWPDANPGRFGLNVTLILIQYFKRSNHSLVAIPTDLSGLNPTVTNTRMDTHMRGFSSSAYYGSVLSYGS
jgi:hypothetical protein